jgi:hypothetical protein
MAAIAASASEQISTGRKPQSLWAIVHSPTVAAALLSGVIALVSAVIGPMRASALQGSVDWTALEQSRKFRKSVTYRRAYDRLSTSYLSLGDAFVGEVLNLSPEV